MISTSYGRLICDVHECIVVMKFSTMRVEAENAFINTVNIALSTWFEVISPKYVLFLYPLMYFACHCITFKGPENILV